MTTPSTLVAGFYIIGAKTAYPIHCASQNSNCHGGVMTPPYGNLCHSNYNLSFPVKGEKVHKNLPVGKIYDGAKSGKLFLRGWLFYVNPALLSTAFPACGKPLWKTLWKMWKTSCYQQVFSLFPQLASGDNPSLFGFHNTKTGCGIVMLRRRNHPILFAPKSYKKLKFYVKMLSTPFPKPPYPKIFC